MINGGPKSNEIKIRAKFPGRCRECTSIILIGDEVYYRPGFGVRCADEEGCRNAQDAASDYTEFPDDDYF